MTPIRVEISPGELLDRLSILQIKSRRIADPAKLQNVMQELKMVEELAEAHIPADFQLRIWAGELVTVNETLWNIEDEIRRHERSKDFGARFVELARLVYITNDHRADLKKKIDTKLGSRLTEEKSYEKYQ